MLKKTRLYVALSLIIQAVSFAALFLILCVKKKSIAYAFLAISALEGAAGAYLLKQVKDDSKEFDPEEILSDDFDLDESMLSSALNRFDESEDDDKESSEVELEDNASEN